MDDPSVAANQVDVSDVRLVEPRDGDLVLAPGAPDLFVGKHVHQMLGEAVGRSSSWVQEQLRRPIDPIPARWGMMGLVVRRDRFALWCLRYGYDTVPRQGLPIVQSRRQIAHYLGVSEPLVKLYQSSRAPWGKIPVRKSRGILWGYVDAIVDWVDSQSMSLPVRDHILASNVRHALLSQPPAKKRRALLPTS
jgi:hypothetical protein